MKMVNSNSNKIILKLKKQGNNNETVYKSTKHRR